MPKSTSKEIVEDSEEEENKSKQNKTRGSPMDTDEHEKKKQADEDDEEGGENGSEEEEEYEIESIRDYSAGAFEGGKGGYLVRWKGYGPEHDSWVTESDAENAKLLIEEYWRKKKKGHRDPLQNVKTRRGRPRSSNDVEKSTSTQKRKKSISTSTPTHGKAATKETDDEGEVEKVGDDEIEEVEEPPKPAKRPKTTSSAGKKATENGIQKSRKLLTPEVEDETHPVADYRPADQELIAKKSWEKIIKAIDTIENLDGELKVFLTLNNGDKVFTGVSNCRERFPQKLLLFYEANLRWRETD